MSIRGNEFDPMFTHAAKIQPVTATCEHPKIMPEWDEAEAKRIEQAGGSVKARFPRAYGKCPDCGWEGILYASYMQYIMGDY